MSGETIEVVGAIKVLAGSSPDSMPNGATVQAKDATYDKMSTDGKSYPDARFVLTCTFSTAPVKNGQIALFARELDIDGTLDADVPEFGRPGRFIGNFFVNNTTSAQTLTLTAIDLPLKADYYLCNTNTGQSMNAGWKLTVQPRTYAPAV